MGPTRGVRGAVTLSSSPTAPWDRPVVLEGPPHYLAVLQPCGTDPWCWGRAASSWHCLPRDVTGHATSRSLSSSTRVSATLNNGIQRRNSRFFTVFTEPRTVSNAYARGLGAVVSKSRAIHLALITCNMSCATWHEERWDSSAVKFGRV